VKDNSAATLAQARLTACRAVSVSVGPDRRLRRDHSFLDRDEKRLAIGNRQAEVFRTLGWLVERDDHFWLGRNPVIVGDLEQDRDAHGSSPVDGLLRSTGA
jgi:hypothetical protein